MKDLNPKEQRKVMDKDYMSISDLMILYGWGRPHATREFKEIIEQLEQEGIPIMQSNRTVLIPRARILQKYPVNYKNLLRAEKNSTGNAV